MCVSIYIENELYKSCCDSYNSLFTLCCSYFTTLYMSIYICNAMSVGITLPSCCAKIPYDGVAILKYVVLCTCKLTHSIID